MQVEKERKGKSDQKKSDLQEKVLFINRCSKVVKGGRRFSFSALVIVGDGQGRVGLGFGKAKEVTDAIRKAVDDGKKNMITVTLEGTSIPFDIEAVHDGSRVLIKAAEEGKGIIAGSHVRSVVEMVGIKDVVAKNLGGNNPMNQARATFKALSQLVSKADTLSKRGL